MTYISGYNNTVLPLLDSATTTATGTPIRMPAGTASYEIEGATTAGAGTATVVIEVTNGGEAWLTLDTLSLTLSTTPSAAGGAVVAPWAYIRARVTAITGTGATVSTYLCV